MSERWVTLQQGASELGISTDAARMRIKRGTLPSYKDANGRVYARLDTEQTESEHSERRQAEGSELVKQLRSEVEYLRGEVEAEREARRRADEARQRADTIIMELLQQAPHLEAPAQPTQRPTEGEESPSGGEGRRPWWKRMFGR